MASTEDDDWSERVVIPYTDEVEYHCPEYVKGQSVRFQSLPAEVLLNIVTCLDPKLDIRALRCMKKAFKGTNIEFLGDEVDQVLEEQRARLLETSFWRCVCKVDGHSHDLDEFIGRQYVSEAEDIQGDKWAFKRSHLPRARGYYFSSRGYSDDMFYQHDRLNINVGNEHNNFEDRIASRLESVLDGTSYWDMLLSKTTPGLKGYGGLCRSIYWG